MSGVQTSVTAVLAIDELLIEIILHVPSILLVRLQLVSKRWQSLIYSPDFRLLRLRRPSPPSFILPTYCGPSGEFFYCSPHQKLLIPFRFKSPPSIILACNNGLILLPTDKQMNYKVYNLTTGKSRRLPHPPCYGHSYKKIKFYLGYEPTRSPDYRVICLPKYERHIYVYESKSRKWTATAIGPSDFCYLRQSLYWVYCNDKLYWIPPYKNYYSYWDLNTRTSGNFPSIHVDVECDQCLLESRGRVYGITRYKTGGNYLDVFLLSEDDSYWSKICTLDCSMWLKGTYRRAIGFVYYWGIDPAWPVSTNREESTILIDMFGKITSFPLSGEASKMIFYIGNNQYYRDVYKFTECFDSV